MHNKRSVDRSDSVLVLTCTSACGMRRVFVQPLKRIYYTQTQPRESARESENVAIRICMRLHIYVMGVIIKYYIETCKYRICTHFSFLSFLIPTYYSIYHIRSIRTCNNYTYRSVPHSNILTFVPFSHRAAECSGSVRERENMCFEIKCQNIRGKRHSNMSLSSVDRPLSHPKRTETSL